jgi:hypothetical protein
MKPISRLQAGLDKKQRKLQDFQLNTISVNRSICNFARGIVILYGRGIWFYCIMIGIVIVNLSNLMSLFLYNNIKKYIYCFLGGGYLPLYYNYNYDYTASFKYPYI